jgi:hypothetical protein
MILDLTYAAALEKADALKALGQDSVYIYDRCSDGFPYDKVTRVEAGNSYRLSGPSSCYLMFEENGLTFRLNVEFEHRDANGKGVSLFDRDRLRDVANKLSPAGRLAFAKMLEVSVLRPLAERTEEYRKALRQQADSEDCVRGIIAFASAEDAA